MEILALSTVLVTMAEMGDKTQLLAMGLAARYQQPRPIILGILCATLANHGGSSVLSAFFGSLVGAEVMRWVVGVAFFGFALYVLKPDKETTGPERSYGAFLATLISFFLVEFGDKTWLATIALAARYHDLLPVIFVVIGSTTGMMVANVPAVYLGSKFGDKCKALWIRIVAALLFAVVGALILVDLDLGLVDLERLEQWVRGVMRLK